MKTFEKYDKRYGKRHEKTLGNARKVPAEGKSLKVVSDFS